MNEETKLMSELEEFDPVPLHVSYPAALAPRLEPEGSGRAEPWGVVVPDLPGCHARILACRGLPAGGLRRR